MDGITASHKIKAMFPNQFIYIVAVTAHTADKEREKCSKAGIQKFFYKPMNPTKIKNALLSLFE